ncbi:hypothetical protein [Mycetocola sp.]|uniref:hypothetical protein n=1 Tax=Mycetocola sp. TaxID=1871042 RepID=UPI0026102553|nr:hypothetical protein [Mycetocola sp.]
MRSLHAAAELEVHEHDVDTGPALFNSVPTGPVRGGRRVEADSVVDDIERDASDG